MAGLAGAAVKGIGSMQDSYPAKGGGGSRPPEKQDEGLN